MGDKPAVNFQRYARAALTTSGCFGILLTTTAVLAQGVVQQVTVRPRPSLPGDTWTVTTYYGCYSIYSGQALNCSFTHRIHGLKPPESDPNNNGGHFHNGDRPLSLAGRPLQHGGDRDPAPYSVSGFTSLSPSQSHGKVVHDMPETAGSLAGESSLVLPPGWICLSRCFTRSSWRYDDTYDIGIRGLEQLPDPGNGDAYTKVRRSLDEDHPNEVSFAGTPLTLQMASVNCRELPNPVRPTT